MQLLCAADRRRLRESCRVTTFPASVSVMTDRRHEFYAPYMRKLIVSNFQTLDGYYESTDKTFHRFFDYFDEDYGENEAFDEYNTELLRNADTLLLSGRRSFM